MAKSERMVQMNRTEPIRPSIKIISKTENPIGTLFCVWSGTRFPDIMSPEDIQELYDMPVNVYSMRDTCKYYIGIADTICRWYPEYAGNDGKDYKSVILSIARKVIESNVPAGEFVSCNIQIDDANVAWREQLVRGRITQQFWTMSTRIMDMTTMDVNMNDSVRIIGGEKAVDKYKECVDFIRETYRFLVDDCGVPMEDIRLQPQNHTHRVYWTAPIRTLITILNKRCDWIAQASLWLPIVAGICQELRRVKLFEIVEPFIGKPMVEVSEVTEYGGGEEFHRYEVTGYIMNADNEDRYSGRDKIPCDPLWLAYKGLSMPEHTDIEFYDYLKSLYIQIWQDKYLKAIGWDRDNPTAHGPYDRPL